MASYQNFANVYDIFMEDIPYQNWFNYVESIFDKYDIKPQSVCELGCGTGKMTTLFANKGYEVIGLDLSAEMLMMAQDVAYEKKLEILYTLQDMADFEIQAPVDIICSFCDSMNYLTEDEELLSCFKKVKQYLKFDGLFVFDMNTPYKYEKVLGNNIFADQTEDAAYVWTNYYDNEEKINEYEVSFFIQKEDGSYDRSIENHYQRAYSLQKVKTLLDKAGLEIIEVTDNYTSNLFKDNSERMTIISKHKANI